MAHKKIRIYEWHQVGNLWMLSDFAKDPKTAMIVSHHPNIKIMRKLTPYELEHRVTSEYNGPTKGFAYDTVFALGRIKEDESDFIPEVEALLFKGNFCYGAEHYANYHDVKSIVESRESLMVDFHTKFKFIKRLAEVFDRPLGRYKDVSKYIDNSNLPKPYVEALEGILKP